MLDMDLLKSRGVSSGDFKKIFTLDAAEMAKVNPRAAKLVQRISDRVKEGRENNLREHHVYAAIDFAYRVPFNQTTATLVQNILAQNMKPDDILASLKKWGLEEKTLFLDVPHPNVPGQTVKMLNPPVFYQILIPIVKAYTTIRAAKLFNDRNESPLLPFSPLKPTERNRVVCEVITDLVETISTWYGYSEVMKDAITHALKYGVMLAFTREEWHYVEHETATGIKDASGRDKGKSKTEKEGLRYIIPHPTRMYYDPQYPLTSINTDTGTEYMGHWSVMRWGDILDNRKYYNRSKVVVGQNWFDEGYVGNYFSEVYPCQLKFPVSTVTASTREGKMALYTRYDRDHAVFITHHFEKIVPADWGLGDYKHPIWIRFDMAGEDTVIWAGPCAYTPAWFIGYDYDAQSPQQSSFALEAIPFQDQLGNILSQMVLTAKQNLANVTYYDSEIVDPSVISNLKNLGERFYRGLNYVPFSSLKSQRAGLKASDAFQTPTLQQKDISQLVTVMSNILSLMERVLQMSAQEVGAAAQHYQSAQEIGVTQTASTNRIAFTGSFVDDGINGWKRQLFDASQAYADTDFMAQVSADIEGLELILHQLGFESQFPGRPKVTISGKRDALTIEGFASNAPGAPRQVNHDLAQVIFQTVGAVSQNPELFNQVGAENVLKLLEQGARLQGAGNEFRLVVKRDANGQVGAEQIKQAMAQMQKDIMENVAKPAAQSAAKQEAEIQQLQQAIEQLKPIAAAAQAITEKNAIKVAETQQSLEAKQNAHALDMQQRQARHEQEMQFAREKANFNLQSQQAETAVSVHGKIAETAASVDAIKEKADAQAEAIKNKPAPPAASSK